MELADNFDFNVGTKHQMRVGILLDGSFYDSFDERNADGTWTYRNIEDYRNDLPMQFSQRIGTLDINYDQFQGGIYWSDEFRLHRDFSLGFGVRNEFQSRIDDKVNLMPRLGFSWAPFGSQRSAVRGGYGLFYDWYDQGLYSQTLRVDGVTVQDIRITCSALNDFCADAANSFDPLAPGVSVARSGRIQASDDLQMPRVHQASISYDRQVTPWLTTQTSYQMLRGRNTMRSSNINAPVDGVRPNPAFGDITQFESTGRTESDRLSSARSSVYQARQQQMGLRFNYTLGQEKNFANGATSLPSEQPEPRRGLGSVERRSAGTASRSRGRCPSCSAFAPTSTAISTRASPYNMTTGFDDNNDGTFNDRPGGVTRNSLRGDWTWGLNLNLSRRINLGRPVYAGHGDTAQRPGVNFQQQGFGGQGGGGQGFGGQGGRGNQGGNNQRFSMEIFARANNVLNHVTRTGYTGNLSSPFFGQPTSVGDPRDINVGLRFNF